MNETTIERLAQKLWRQAGCPFHPDNIAAAQTGGPRVPDWQAFTGNATDILKFLREPSDAVLEKTRALNRFTDAQTPKSIWRDMIDSALSEKLN